MHTYIACTPGQWGVALGIIEATDQKAAAKIAYKKFGHICEIWLWE